MTVLLPRPVSVVFTDLLSSGPQSGQVVTLGTAILSAGTAALTVDLPGFNTNTITATYSGDAAYAAATSAPAGVQVTAYTGEVIIDQFRLSGPGGAADQYAELYNAGPPVSLGGFNLAASSGASVTVPSSAPVLRLAAPTSSPEALFPGRCGSQRPAGGQPGTGGLQVIAPDGLGTMTDAAGSAGARSGFFSGTSLPALSGTPADQYAWVRLEAAGAPVNSGSNAADFQLVSTSGGVVGGVQSASARPPRTPPVPGPGQRGLPVRPAGSRPEATAAPNFVYVHGTPGLLTIRRTITSTS